MKSRTEIMSSVCEVIATFENREYSGEIVDGTHFFADLGFVSIDAVLLGERLEQYFSQPIPFAQFLSELAGQNVTDIRVGELVDFLAKHLQ